MSLSIEVPVQLCSLIISKKARLKYEIDNLDDLIKNESEESLRQLHLATRKERSFEYKFNFKPKPGDIDSLIEIFNISPNIREFQMRDAYWVWKSKNGDVQTEFEERGKKIAKVLFRIACGGVFLSPVFALIV